MSSLPQHLDLTPEQALLLSELTLKTHKSPEQVVEDALRQYSDKGCQSKACQNDETGLSLFERLERDGLVGSVDNCPSDLSTNPDYMEGFGESR